MKQIVKRILPVVLLTVMLAPTGSSASDGGDDVAETVAAKVSQLREARAKWRAVGLAKLRLAPKRFAPLPSELPAPDEKEKRELERLRQMDGGDSAFEVQQTIKALDSALRETVSCAFEAGLSFEEVQRVTQGLVKWEQWPDVFGLGYEYVRPESSVLDSIPQGLRSGEQMGKEAWLAEENLVIVGYRTRQAPSGETVYAFQNSLWGMDYGRLRFLMSAYAVAKGAEVHCSTFFINKYPYQAGLLDSTLFLGFVDRPDSLPWILTASGPTGNWACFSLLGYRFDPDTKAWTHAMGSDNESYRDYIRSYEYNASTGILTLRDADFRSKVEQRAEPLENDTSTFDIGKEIDEIEEKLAKPEQ